MFPLQQPRHGGFHMDGDAMSAEIWRLQFLLTEKENEILDLGKKYKKQEVDFKKELLVHNDERFKRQMRNFELMIQYRFDQISRGQQNVQNEAMELVKKQQEVLNSQLHDLTAVSKALRSSRTFSKAAAEVSKEELELCMKALTIQGAMTHEENEQLKQQLEEATQKMNNALLCVGMPALHDEIGSLGMLLREAKGEVAELQAERDLERAQLAKILAEKEEVESTMKKTMEEKNKEIESLKQLVVQKEQEKVQMARVLAVKKDVKKLQHIFELGNKKTNMLHDAVIAVSKTTRQMSKVLLKDNTRKTTKVPRQENTQVKVEIMEVDPGQQL